MAIPVLLTIKPVQCLGRFVIISSTLPSLIVGDSITEFSVFPLTSIYQQPQFTEILRISYHSQLLSPQIELKVDERKNILF